jgi:hypothetical protein
MKIDYFGKPLKQEYLSKCEKWILLVWFDDEYGAEWVYWCGDKSKAVVERWVQEKEKEGVKAMMIHRSEVATA